MNSNEKQKTASDSHATQGGNPNEEPKQDRKKKQKVWRTQDIGPGHQSLKPCISYRKVNRLYSGLKSEYRYEKVFWVGARFILPAIIFCLFLVSVVGISLNFANISDSIVRFGTSSDETSQNEIFIPINLHNWAKTAYKNGNIKYDKDSKRFAFTYGVTSTDENQKIWSDVSSQFDSLTAKIKKIAKQSDVIVDRVKNDKFKKYDFPTIFEKILQRGINFYSLQMGYYNDSANGISDYSGANPTPNDAKYYDSMYILPLASRNNINDESFILPTPTLFLNVNSYYKNFSGESPFIKKFEKKVNDFLRVIGTASDTNSDLSYFSGAQFINTALNNNSNITSILPVYNIALTAHTQAVLYFKDSLIAIIIIFVILLIYLLFRYHLNSVLAILFGGIALLLLLFVVLTLLFPVVLPVYTILILMVLLFLFNSGYFIHRTAAHLKAYEKKAHFVFAKKNDIKKIAFDVLMRMKRSLLFQLVAFCGLGLMLAIGFSLPFFHFNSVHEFMWYGVLLFFATIVTITVFVFSFVYLWIQFTYYYLNIKKAYVINCILYQRVTNNEQVIAGINDYWEEINLKQLLYLNPEIREIINLDDRTVIESSTAVATPTRTQGSVVQKVVQEEQKARKKKVVLRTEKTKTTSAVMAAEQISDSQSPTGIAETQQDNDKDNNSGDITKITGREVEAVIQGKKMIKRGEITAQTEKVLYPRTKQEIKNSETTLNKDIIRSSANDNADSFGNADDSQLVPPNSVIGNAQEHSPTCRKDNCDVCFPRKINALGVRSGSKNCIAVVAENKEKTNKNAQSTKKTTAPKKKNNLPTTSERRPKK